MTHILSSQGRDELAHLAACRSLIAFDFDGTLAPIVEEPDAGHVADRTRNLLARVARLYPCLVLTGRSREDAAARLAGLGIRAICGNHGADLGDQRRLARQVAGWRVALHDETLPPGVWIEDKRLSLTVHYRGCSRAAQRSVKIAVQHLPGARLTCAKEALNLVPENAPNKGDALCEYLLRWDCERALFVGDDATDEDVFALSPSAVLGVRVGRSRVSSAKYWLRGQHEVDALLVALAELREAQYAPRASRTALTVRARM